MDNFYSIKIIVVGDVGVGKTHIIYRYINGDFENEDYSPTLGVEFSSKNVKVDDNEAIFHLELWDTGGMESFKSIRQNYYKNTACVIFVYEIISQASLDSVDNWIEECDLYNNNNNLIKILIGNKTDLNDQRQVTEEQGRSIAEKYDMIFYEASALNGYNINTIFLNLVNQIYNLIKNENKEYKGISRKSSNNNLEIDEVVNFSSLSIQLVDKKNNKRDKRKICCC